MKTIRPIFATRVPALSVLFVAMSASAELRAQAEPTPETKPQPPAEAETKPETETKPAADTAPAPATATPPEIAPPTAFQTPEMKAMMIDIKQQAERCSEAQLKMDFEGLLPYVPKKLLEMMGGREVLKTKLAQGNAVLKSRGVTIDSAVIGNPEPPQKHEGVYVALVPMTTNLTTPQGKVIATSSMVAISEDNAASWSFVDTSTVNEEKLGVLYPALKGKVKFPPATAKVVK